MIYLSQRDPKWCENKLGGSKLTIGRYGCTTTCISMLSDYFGYYLSPDKIAANKTFYTKDGLILWQNLNIVSMKFERREYGEVDNEIIAALKDKNRAVMLEVNNGQHWVVAVKKNMIGDDYVVADPWLGDKCGVKKRYHNITGAAYFSRS